MRSFEELVDVYKRDKAIHDCENVIGRLIYNTATFMTDDIIEMWADRADSTLEMPFGAYIGIQNVKRFYTEIMGDRSNPDVLETIKGVMCVSTLDTQILEVAGDRQTARGTWYSPGIETYGNSARFPEFVGKGYWSWCKIACDFIFEEGEWKIWHLRIHQIFRTEYHTPWTETNEYRGYPLCDPACDRASGREHTGYDITVFQTDDIEVPAAYYTFADIAPGYGLPLR